MRLNSYTTLPLAVLAYLSMTGVAWAGTITAQGNVTALTHVNQLQDIVGTATFNEANMGIVPLGLYTPAGMTFHTGPFANILANVGELGSAFQPAHQSAPPDFFPAPIAGGGIATGSFTSQAGVVTFSQPVTQFGLTASLNGTQYITVWDTNGAMIGQVTWQPADDAAFVGIDTNGVPIGMLSYGNDNMWNGATYNIQGLTVLSDHWSWALGIPCESDADCIDDDNPCTLNQCIDGICLYPNTPDGVCPDDGNPCTDDVCNAGSCQYPDNADPCDDEDACTELDFCVQGECEGSDLVCNDANLCSTDSCDSAIGCVFDFQVGCCASDEDCMPGEICQFGSNSCIPDPNVDTETTDEGDTAESTTDEGESTTDTGDEGESTEGTESDGDDAPGTDGMDEVATLDTFGGNVDDEGCGCTTDHGSTGALFGLFGLALLGAIRRRRDDGIA
jgi:MYXO-CTERM domain-containing protein